MPNRRTPAVVERCVARVAERLTPLRGPRAGLSGAYAICTAQAQRRGLLAPGSRALTAEGRRAERRARRRPGLARAERAVSRMAADARREGRKRNGGTEVEPAPLYRLRLSHGGGLGARLLEFDVVLRASDVVTPEGHGHKPYGADYLRRFGAMRRALYATRRRLDPSGTSPVDATPGAWTLHLPPRISASDEQVMNVAAEEVRAADGTDRGPKRNEWPYGPRALSARIRNHDADYDASLGPEAFGVRMNHGRVEVRGHFAPAPGYDPRLPSFVPVAAYDTTYGRPRRRLDLRAALGDVDDRLLESVAWGMRERVLSPALCEAGGAARGACPDVRLLTLKGGRAADNAELRLRERWPEGVTSARMYVGRVYGERDLPLRGRKPNRYTVGRDDDSRSRPFAVYDASGDVVHRAATRDEADALAAEENRVLAEKRAARAAR